MPRKLRELETSQPASLLDSSQGSEGSLVERSLVDKTARPGTPLQRRLQGGDQPPGSRPSLGDRLEEGDHSDSEEEERQQLSTMADQDVSRENNVETLREGPSKIIYVRGHCLS